MHLNGIFLLENQAMNEFNQVFHIIPEPLKQYIKRCYTFSYTGPEVWQPCFPSECHFFNHFLSGLGSSLKVGETTITPKKRSFFTGNYTKLAQVFLKKGTSIFHIEFADLAIFKLYKKADLENFHFGELHEFSALELEKEMANSTSEDEVKNQVFKDLIERSKTALLVDQRIEKALTLIKEGQGAMKVIDLCNRVEVKEKTLNRLFKKYIGLTVKQYSKLLQFNLVVSALKEEKFDNLLELTKFFGFYDQAHFVNAFKQKVLMNPTDFLKGEERLLSVYLGN